MLREGLWLGQTVILMQRFDAAHVLDLIERQRVTFAALVPTAMGRVLRQPDIQLRDLSSLQVLFHSAGPCPPWVKRGWLALLGPEKVIEGYGATESPGNAIIRGDEWLAHPGSVGRPAATDIRILDEAGRDLPPGEVGDIYLRRHGRHGPDSYYIGAPPAKQTPDGFTSVGDLGWLDADGYLYLADRRTDLIISGGANVYP